MVRIHYREGVATHAGPESRVGGCEAIGEALTGEHAGEALSGVSKFPSADAVTVAEGNMVRRDIACVGGSTLGPHWKDFGRNP